MSNTVNNHNEVLRMPLRKHIEVTPEMIAEYDRFVQDLRDHPEKYKKRKMIPKDEAEFELYCKAVEDVFGNDIGDLLRSWNTDFFPKAVTEEQVTRIVTIGQDKLYEIASINGVDPDLGSLAECNLWRIIRQENGIEVESPPVDINMLFNPSVEQTEKGPAFSKIYIPF